MEEDEKQKPPSLYKYVTISTLKLIVSGGLRFTQPSALNDPFELSPELYIPEGTDPDTKVNIQFDTIAPRRSSLVEEIDPSKNYSDLTSRNIIATLNKSIGIVCFSRNPESLLMWAHYGEQYAGAIIKFDGSKPFFHGQFDVEYRAERPKKNMATYLRKGEPVPIAELCVKSDQWRYEDEVRIVRSLADCVDTGKTQGDFRIFIQEVPEDCITEIIMGERTPVHSQRELWQLFKDTNIGLSLSAVANRDYAFRKEVIKFSGSKLGPNVSPRTAHIFSHLQTPFGEMARWMIENHPMSSIVNSKA